MRLSIKTAFLLITIVSILLVPIAWMLNHVAAWGPAEHVADTLHSLAGEVLEKQLAEEEILDLLQSPQYQHHGLHEIHANIAKRNGELIWFSPNNKYSVGLGKKGTIL